jgi:hypothetical protein
MNFQSYSLSYQLLNDTVWTPIVIDSLTEINHANLALWNTNGLQAGMYLLRLVTRNNLSDSIESFVNIELLASVVGNPFHTRNFNAIDIIPNPSQTIATINFEVLEDDIYTIELTDLSGKKVHFNTEQIIGKRGNHQFTVDVQSLSNGMYFLSINGQHQNLKTKLVVKH